MVLSYVADRPLVVQAVPAAQRVEVIYATRPSFVDSEATDTWARTIEQIPTTAGKLAYVARLKQQDAARYHHEGLARIYSKEQADRVLRASHETVFAEWLNFSLEQQYNDLRVHLLSSQLEPEELKGALALQSYRELIPASAHEPEKALYLGDLETVLELLRREI